MLVLDTHALIWAHAGVRIPKKVAQQITAAGQRGRKSNLPKGALAQGTGL
jgi:hypothetical protein